jgi:hypothetical protein
MSESPDYQTWLEDFLRGHRGIAGTVHVRPPDGDLELAAGAGVALPVRDALGRVRAVVGIAYRGERTLETTELRALERAVEGLPTRSPEQV